MFDCTANFIQWQVSSTLYTLHDVMYHVMWCHDYSIIPEHSIMCKKSVILTRAQCGETMYL